MRKAFFTIFLIIYSFTSFGQFISSIDCANGDYESLRTATTVLQLFEEGRCSEINQFLSENINIQDSEINTICLYVADQFSYDLGSPPCVQDSSQIGLWYDRTYYTINEGEIEYLGQIYLKLEDSNGETVVSFLEFRIEEKIESKGLEITLLTNVSMNNPPPPPAPRTLIAAEIIRQVSMDDFDEGNTLFEASDMPLFFKGILRMRGPYTYRTDWLTLMKDSSFISISCTDYRYGKWNIKSDTLFIKTTAVRSLLDTTKSKVNVETLPYAYSFPIIYNKSNGIIIQNEKTLGSGNDTIDSYTYLRRKGD